MSGSLLDTSVVIAGDDARHLRLPEAAAISVITLGELQAGVLLAGDPATAEMRGRRLARVRAAFAPLAVDETVAMRYGNALQVARRQGRATKATDLLIIATAAATGRDLWTLDAAQARLARAAGVATSAV